MMFFCISAKYYLFLCLATCLIISLIGNSKYSPFSRDETICLKTNGSAEEKEKPVARGKKFERDVKSREERNSLPSGLLCSRRMTSQSTL